MMIKKNCSFFYTGTKNGIRQYRWLNVGMVGYDPKDNLYIVRSLVNDEKMSQGSKAIQYMIARIRLMFFAEDPNTFAARVKEAFEARKKAEDLIRFEDFLFIPGT